MQQLTTLGVPPCWLGMAGGVPALYLLLGSWMPGKGWLQAEAALGWSLPALCLGLYMIAGALVAAAAGLRLLLGPGEAGQPAIDVAAPFGPDR